MNIDYIWCVCSRPINDLDDVRTEMNSLKEIREAEIRIDSTIAPIEESYALLNKFELYFDDGNSERVDGLAYQWRNLLNEVINYGIYMNQDVKHIPNWFCSINNKCALQVVRVQSTLLEVQPGFKATLLSGVQQFAVDVNQFYKDYDSKWDKLLDIRY